MLHRLAFLVAGAYAASAPLTLLTDPKARCMDGTLSGFYYQPSLVNNTKWVLYLQGGGECTTENACKGALNGPLGSSKFFPNTTDFDGAFYASDNKEGNPDFYDWNHVNIPYCSQDLHSGQILKPSAETWGLYFSGRFVFVAIIEALEGLTGIGGLASATEIIVTGASAGGIGVWYHLDWLQERYPHARVVGAPVAGFYFWAFYYQGPNATTTELADFRPQAWVNTYALWQPFVDESCAAAHPATPWYCMLSNYSFPYISVEVFASEAQTDQVVITDHDCVPPQYLQEAPEQAYLQAWHANMTIALSPLAALSNARNGIFNPACFIHTSFSPSAPLINGLNFLQAFGNFYYQRSAPQMYKLADSCGIMCNPTCPT
jgi:hypothetical protein